jgi:predicted PurR-regulated permease PerM
MDKAKTKQLILIITYGVILFLGILNLTSVLQVIGALFSVLHPVVYGIVIAYLINIPYRWFRVKVFIKLEARGNRLKVAAIILSLISSYVAVLAVIGVLFRFIIPQLVSSVTQLIQNIPYYFTSLSSYFNRYFDYFGLNHFLDKQVDVIWSDLNARVASVLSDAIPFIGNSVISLTSVVINLVIGFVISIYLIFAKETLIRQGRKLLFAFGPKRYIKRILELFTRANLIFYRFITGNLIDALIIGIVCFIGLSVMKMPFALLVSVIVGVTNIIPIFGPFIGAIPSFFIILAVDPIKALLFLVFIIALQQADGNIIKPHVFGNYVGLPSLWVLVSIVVGGGLFGIVGMLLAVPTFALFYSILRDETNARSGRNDLL